MIKHVYQMILTAQDKLVGFMALTLMSQRLTLGFTLYLPEDSLEICLSYLEIGKEYEIPANFPELCDSLSYLSGYALCLEDGLIGVMIFWVGCWNMFDFR